MRENALNKGISENSKHNEKQRNAKMLLQCYYNFGNLLGGFGNYSYLCSRFTKHH